MMKKHILLVLLLTVLTGANFNKLYAQCGPLETLYNQNNGQDGIMFDIVAITPVIITAIDMDMDVGNHVVEIYSRPGTHVGFTGGMAGWTLEGTANVNVVGEGYATVNQIPLNVSICDGQRHAFYITATAASFSGANYTNGTGVGNVWIADANIQILEGTGKGYWAGDYAPRKINGRVSYDCAPPPGPAANAGPDQTICGTNSATMAASAGGMWTVVSGTGTFSDVNDPNATVTGLSVGVNQFQWSTACPTTTDIVEITFNTGPDVDDLTDVVECDSYTLPAITGTNLTGNEAYFTATNGGGTQYNAGDVINTAGTTTLYIYDETGTVPNCFDEETVDITINMTPSITSPGNQTECSAFTFPAIAGTNLTGNEAYFTATNGGGTQYNAGDVFNTAGTTTFYIYDETGTTPNCFDEVTFDVTVGGPDITVQADETVCDTYTFPAIAGTGLTGNEAFYTAPNGGGTQYNTGDTYTTSGTVTIYIYDETGTTPNCFDEETFQLTVNPSPDVTAITDESACDSYTLPAIPGTDLTGNEAYYTAPNGGGTQYNIGDVINTAGANTLYAYDETSSTPNCFDEESFVITINTTPDVDPIVNQNACGTYTLPAITGTNLSGNEAYYDAPNGGGNQYNPGDIINTAGTTTLYIYDETGSTPNCFDEETFDVIITTTLTFTITYTDPTICGTPSDGTITISGLTSNTTFDVTYTYNGAVQGPAALTSDANGDIILSNLDAGDYTDFLVDNNGCNGTDNTVYTLIPPTAPAMSIIPPSATCEGSTAILSTNLTGAHTWSDNSTNTTFDVTTSGTYWVEVDDGSGCISRDTIDVTFKDQLLLDINPVPESCIDKMDGTVEVELLQGDEPLRFSWLNGDTARNPQFAPGIYTVNVTNEYGCSFKDTVTIDPGTEPCADPSVYIPNIFSPNGDGINDVFKPYGEDITGITMRIFDRWGKQVFFSTNIDAEWDGKRNGKPLNTAVFAYQIRITFSEGISTDYQGNVTLVRKQ